MCNHVNTLNIIIFINTVTHLIAIPAGFDALEYQEHLDYDLVQSTNPEFNKAVVRVNIFRDHRQTIQVGILLCAITYLYSDYSNFTKLFIYLF
jgi:hypothetical protein